MADAVIIDPWTVAMKVLQIIAKPQGKGQYNFKTLTDAVEKYRKPHQVYVYWATESPISEYYPFWVKRLESMDRMDMQPFNATATYRLDSTYPKRYYGVVRREKPLNETFSHELYVSKHRPIVWFLSSCQMPLRIVLANELAKHIEIDMYGSCYKPAPKECGNEQRHSNACWPYIEQTYFFHLSLENSVCRDYVTEKLRNAMANRVIPIVIKRSIAEGVGHPASSFIAFDDFDSMKEMAAYLQKVMSNESLYESYFDWKQTLQVTKLGPESNTRWNQNLCSDLWSGRSYQSVNISQWFYNAEHTECIDFHIRWKTKHSLNISMAMDMLIRNRDIL